MSFLRRNPQNGEKSLQSLSGKSRDLEHILFEGRWNSNKGLMSPQTETKAGVGFQAGVKDYKLTYYTPEYETKDTDILAAFRVTPQPGVPPEEAGAAVAAESSTGTWTTVWTDGLTSLDRYKGRCYHIEPVPGDEQSIYLLCNVLVSKPYVLYVWRIYEFPLLIPKLSKVRLSAETGEIKGHYLNATAGTCEEMIKRAAFARELGVPIVRHDYLPEDSLQILVCLIIAAITGLLLHIHRAMHAVIDRQKNHGMHFRVLAKALRMSGGDHIHSGTVVGKLEGERESTLGFVDLLRDDFIEKDRARGIFFTQDWVSMPGVIPVASGGIHVWHMPALTDNLWGRFRITIWWRNFRTSLGECPGCSS
ncbi:hypothetical protein ACP4OV_031257 [Aristida adscensionis]